MTPNDASIELLEKLFEIGISLSSEDNLDALLEKILQAAKGITRADGGTLYLVTPDSKHLQFKLIHNDTLGISYGGISGTPLESHFQDIPLYLETGEQNLTTVAAYAGLTGKTVNIADAYATDGFDFSGTRVVDLKSGYRSQSFLTVPMKNHEGELIGVLQLINAVHLTTSGQPSVGEFSLQHQRLTESLASQAAIALSNRRLIEQMKSLFEAMILMINKAIEDKSEYTGGHCERVPQLTLMLAEALNTQTDGKFASCHLDERAQYELRIASLLHDCGKLVTPEHIVDKATKLETIYDRIGLIDTRIEIIKRDAEIAYLKSLRDSTQTDELGAAKTRYTQFLSQIEADRVFLHDCNRGGLRINDDEIARIQQIASQYSWVNPAGELSPLLSADEIENLSIRVGTLNTKERNIINYHINATINMLEALPWPVHLSQVPVIAGGHHERFDGQGYPKGLQGKELSLQARMLAIADIFEALTAFDRPYKKPMTLSQALHVMDSHVAAGHIDPDLYRIFVNSGVPQRYGQIFLPPEQLDI